MDAWGHGVLGQRLALTACFVLQKHFGLAPGRHQNGFVQARLGRSPIAQPFALFVFFGLGFFGHVLDLQCLKDKQLVALVNGQCVAGLVRQVAAHITAVTLVAGHLALGFDPVA